MAIVMERKAGATPRKASARVSRLDDPEVDLMLRVGQDDTEAFGALVKRYWSPVFARFYRRLNDRQLAEDLTQEVFLRLYRHRKRYRPTAKFATWIFHIAENLFRNALRARRRHPSVRLDSYGALRAGPWTPDQWLCDPGESPSKPMERAELACLVRHGISGLNGRQRAALELHQFEDLTYAQIADQLAITPEAAKSLLYRARNQLRANLTNLMEGEA